MEICYYFKKKTIKGNQMFTSNCPKDKLSQQLDIVRIREIRKSQLQTVLLLDKYKYKFI